MTASRRKPATTPAAKRPDGRRQRSEVNRRKIIAALFELVREGNFLPSADQVAQRAHVGRRTVFRLFDDMDSLYQEMNALMLARVMPIFAEPLKGADWRERLSALIERRARVFEEILPVKAAADAHRHRSHFLQQRHAEFTAMQRDMLKFVLPKAVAADRITVEALDLICSMESWRRLRTEQRLSPRSATAVLKVMVNTMLARKSPR